jgi:hypothetical protein
MENALNFKITQLESVDKRNTALVKSFDSFLTDNLQKHLPTIKKIRLSQDKTITDALKKTLPVCQFCITNGRGVNGIIEHSDIMQIDIDAKDNPHIYDLKETIKDIPFIFFAMHSVSGKGLMALIKIQNPNQYKAHFEAFKTFIKANGQIVVDSAVSNPTSLRFWSYDDNPIVNNNAKVWSYIPKIDTIIKPSKPYINFGTEINPFDNYNKHGDIENLLIKYGWKYQPNCDKGTRRRYTRPGKTNGISADWCIERRILYVFSNSSETLLGDAGKGYNPIQIFLQLECTNNKKLCAEKLKALGFGV